MANSVVKTIAIFGAGGGGTANSKSVETTTAITARPTVAYGSISIGMRF